VNGGTEEARRIRVGGMRGGSSRAERPTEPSSRLQTDKRSGGGPQALFERGNAGEFARALCAGRARFDRRAEALSAEATATRRSESRVPAKSGKSGERDAVSGVPSGGMTAIRLTPEDGEDTRCEYAVSASCTARWTMASSSSGEYDRSRCRLEYQWYTLLYYWYENGCVDSG
jgi:hypothetical protein